jgi:hypothetical protein
MAEPQFVVNFDPFPGLRLQNNVCFHYYFFTIFSQFFRKNVPLLFALSITIRYLHKRHSFTPSEYSFTPTHIRLTRNNTKK